MEMLRAFRWLWTGLDARLVAVEATAIQGFRHDPG